MSKIRDELLSFLERTGIKQIHLARLSGLHPASISYMVRNKRKDMTSENAEKLRAAMKQYEAEKKGI